MTFSATNRSVGACGRPWTTIGSITATSSPVRRGWGRGPWRNALPWRPTANRSGLCCWGLRRLGLGARGDRLRVLGGGALELGQLRVLRRRLLAGLYPALLKGRLVDLFGYPLNDGGLNQLPHALVDRRGADGPRADDALLQGTRRTHCVTDKTLRIIYEDAIVLTKGFSQGITLLNVPLRGGSGVRTDQVDGVWSNGRPTF